MPQIGRIDNVIQRVIGSAITGAAIEIRRQGATVAGNQSNTSPFTVNVADQGGILAGDTVAIDTGSTTYNVNSITATTVVLSGFAGTLVLTDRSRITPTNALPTLYTDAQAVGTTPNPTTTSTPFGQYAIWVKGLPYDVKVSGSDSVTRLYQDVRPAAESWLSNLLDGAGAVAWASDTVRSLVTSGAKLFSFRNAGVEKAFVDKDGGITSLGGTSVFPTLTGTNETMTTDTILNAIIARLGPASTPTTGGALRVIDGVQFPLTVAGLQAALDECEAAGGGTVMIPAQAGISITNTSVKVGNRVRLCGHGAFGSTATFLAANTANVSAMVENKIQDGTQQYAYLEHIQINGNKGGGAIVTAGVHYKKIFVGSRLKDVLVTACSGNGLLIESGGQYFADNLAATNCNDHNILITGSVSQFFGFQIDSESVAAGKAQIKITNNLGTASFGHVIIGAHFEGTNASDGIWLDGVCNVTLIGTTDNGSGAANNVVKITGSVAGFDGVFAAGGHTLINTHGNLATIIDDQVAGIQIGNAQGRFVRWYSSPVSSALDKSQIVGLQVQRVGVTMASASTITPGDGNVFIVTGNTTINTITANARDKGRRITLVLTTGAPQFGIAGNLRLPGSVAFSTSTGSSVSFICHDGVNWWLDGSVII